MVVSPSNIVKSEYYSGIRSVSSVISVNDSTQGGVEPSQEGNKSATPWSQWRTSRQITGARPGSSRAQLIYFTGTQSITLSPSDIAGKSWQMTWNLSLMWKPLNGIGLKLPGAGEVRMVARKGLLAPQNTFLDTIAARFDGTREYLQHCNIGLQKFKPNEYKNESCKNRYCHHVDSPLYPSMYQRNM